MDRRDFLRTLGVAAAVAGTGLNGAPLSGKSKKPAPAAEDGLHLRFLGTGAADWHGPDARGEHRRFSSVLLDGRILIDFTASNIDMLPQGCKPECVFYTHSHGDHYNPKALVDVGVPLAYLNVSWIARARNNFSEVSLQTGLPAPKLVPLNIADKTVCGDITITALPANHAVNLTEQTMIYLIEKGPVRLLYATDTGGIPALAARLIGIDSHDSHAQPINGLIMEATMGMGDKGDEDFRLFTHSSVDTVRHTVNMLLKHKRYLPQEGQPVYLTHFARTLQPTQKELEATLPAPLVAAYDGLEITFKA
ncbi:MAG: MBL fold metallo-hydrolase [Bacteroidales bacterium]|nr:MBL fold metallo-hydrolase [Bacteroidales bacterium]